MRTLSVFRASCGGYVGAGGVHPAVLDAARRVVAEAKAEGVLTDAYVSRCGDDVVLVCLHGDDLRTEVDGAVARAFASSGGTAADLGQHDARRNGGPPIERTGMCFSVRSSEPVLCFLADRTAPGAWNLHLYRVFADPFNTGQLMTDPAMRVGFRFRVLDRLTAAERVFDLPDDLHPFLADVTSGHTVITRVIARSTGRIAASASTGPDPVLVVRSEGGLPSVGEALEPFAFPYAVAGWLGDHPGPLVPVAITDDAPSRLDGPPRAIGLGFQVTPDRLVGPRDLLGGPAFDEARRHAVWAADYLRRHGPFSPRSPQPPATTPNGGHVRETPRPGAPTQ